MVCGYIFPCWPECAVSEFSSTISDGIFLLPPPPLQFRNRNSSCRRTEVVFSLKYHCLGGKNPSLLHLLSLHVIKHTQRAASQVPRRWHPHHLQNRVCCFPQLSGPSSPALPSCLLISKSNTSLLTSDSPEESLRFPWGNKNESHTVIEGICTAG